MGTKDEYDWLDDPFNEKKNAQERAASTGMSGGTKAAVGCGCLAVVLGILVTAVLFLVGLGSVLAS